MLFFFLESELSKDAKRNSLNAAHFRSYPQHHIPSQPEYPAPPAPKRFESCKSSNSSPYDNSQSILANCDNTHITNYRDNNEGITSNSHTFDVATTRTTTANTANPKTSTTIGDNIGQTAISQPEAHNINKEINNILTVDNRHSIISYSDRHSSSTETTNQDSCLEASHSQTEGSSVSTSITNPGSIMSSILSSKADSTAGNSSSKANSKASSSTISAAKFFAGTAGSESKTEKFGHPYSEAFQGTAAPIFGPKYSLTSRSDISGVSGSGGCSTPSTTSSHSGHVPRVFQMAHSLAINHKDSKGPKELKGFRELKESKSFQELKATKEFQELVSATGFNIVASGSGIRYVIDNNVDAVDISIDNTSVNNEMSHFVDGDDIGNELSDSFSNDSNTHQLGTTADGEMHHPHTLLQPPTSPSAHMVKIRLSVAGKLKMFGRRKK